MFHPISHPAFAAAGNAAVAAAVTAVIPLLLLVFLHIPPPPNHTAMHKLRTLPLQPYPANLVGESVPSYPLSVLPG